MDLVIGLDYTNTMAESINVHQAKTHFSKLLARIDQGEEIIISRAGKPVARLLPIAQPAVARRVPGIDKGKIRVATDFNTISAPELDAWFQAYLDTK